MHMLHRANTHHLQVYMCSVACLNSAVDRSIRVKSGCSDVASWHAQVNPLLLARPGQSHKPRA